MAEGAFDDQLTEAESFEYFRLIFFGPGSVNRGSVVVHFNTFVEPGWMGDQRSTILRVQAAANLFKS